jgi:hypothetical protein
MVDPNLPRTSRDTTSKHGIIIYLMLAGAFILIFLSIFYPTSFQSIILSILY